MAGKSYTGHGLFRFLSNRIPVLARQIHTLSLLMSCKVISENSAMRKLVGLIPINNDDEFDMIEENLHSPKPPANPSANIWHSCIH